MNKIKILAAMAVLALTGCASAAHPIGGSTPAPHQAAATSAPATSPPAVPDPKGEWVPAASCDVSLSPSLNGSNYLVASVHLQNTGNVGMTTSVRVTWPQEGFAPITRTKDVKVPWHASKDVSFRVPARDYSQDVIGAFQNVQLASSKMDVCRYRVRITGSYGTAH